MGPLAWLGWSCFEYYLTTINSDCGYSASEACTHIANYQQQVVIWRGLAVQFALIIILQLTRKR
jgi:hypothetical protein